MDGPLQILTQLSVLLILGLLGTALAARLRTSNVLILLLGGLIIGRITDYFSFDPVFLVAVATVTLAMVIFEGTSKLSYRQVDRYSGPALRMTLWFLLLTTILLGAAGYALFFAGMPNGVLLSLVLAVALAGTDPSTVTLMLTNTNQRVMKLLTLEAIVNTPMIVVIPFMLIDTVDKAFSAARIAEFGLQIVAGVGAGVVLGLLIFKALRRFYQAEISNVAVVAGALLSYILAENLGGSGVLAVATLGIMFGNFHIKRKEDVQDFSFAFSNTLEMLIFLLIGIIIGRDLPLTLPFLGKTLGLFVALVAARMLAAWPVMREEYDLPEIAFASVTMPKGIAVAVLIFSFTLIPIIPSVLLSALFAISIYSIVAATASTLWWNRREA